MQIPRATDGKRYAMPEAATSKDGSRPVLGEPWLEIGSDGAGTVYATDSYVAVSIPVELDGEDTPGVIPAAALKVARTLKYGEPRISLNGSAVADGKDGTVTVPRPDLGEQPRVSAFFTPLPEDARTFEVCLDAAKLAQVSKALGAEDGVRLTFQLEEGDNPLGFLKPVRVKPLQCLDDREGLVMPIKPRT